MNVHKRKTFKVPGYARHSRNESLEDNAKGKAAEAMRKGLKEFMYLDELYVLYDGEFVVWSRATNPALIGR